MKNRLRVAIPIVAAFWLLLLYWPAAGNLLTGLLILRSLYEFYQIYHQKGYLAFGLRGLLFSAVYLTAAARGWHGHLPALAFAGLALLFLSQLADRDNHRGMEKMALTLLGWGYVVWPGSHFFFLQRLEFAGGPHGIGVLLAIIFSSKFGDAAAYVGGTRFGKHKLIPRISPGKSWEGVAFGIVGSFAPLPYLVSGPGLTYASASGLCLVVAVASLFGDLAESMLKREMNLKDAADFLPGFGGTLDIIDALIFALPAGYWFLVLTGTGSLVY